jgi:molybdopterin-dependent oxidoreductase alpha subunit
VKDSKSSKAGGWPALAASTAKILEAKNLGKSVRSLLKVNQPDGFDCPGCAWPDPKDTAITEFCENGVKAVTAETTGKRVSHGFFAQHTVTDLLDKTDYWLEQQGRLTEPMAYDPEKDTYVAVSWEEAFRRIAETLNALDSPDEAIFYTSGRTSNEAAFLYQLFVRMFGTNNLPDCSNMCHESSGVAMIESIGIGKGTVVLEDFDKADLILIMGQNPGTNHPRMLTELQKARKRGAEIITLNPLVEKGLESFLHPQHPAAMLTNRATPISSLYLQPLIGGDLAALKGIMKWILEFEDEAPGKVLDHAFIEEHTSNFDDFRKDIESTAWDLIEKESGIQRGRPEECSGNLHTFKDRDRLLGDGSHPAQARRPDHPADPQPALPARKYRQAGRRGLPRARTQQRPGRPDHGYPRKTETGVPLPVGRRFSHSGRLSGTASTPWLRSRPWPMAMEKSSSAWAAISPAPRRILNSPRPPCASASSPPM